MLEANAGHELATGTDGYGFNATITSPTATAFDGTPEAPINADPQFVDPTRNIKTWDAENGGAGSIDSALAEIRKRNNPVAEYNPAYTINGLYTWVKAGYAPTNPELHAAHDSGWIGAVEGITSSNSASNSAVMVGVGIGI